MGGVSFLQTEKLSTSKWIKIVCCIVFTTLVWSWEKGFKVWFFSLSPFWEHGIALSTPTHDSYVLFLKVEHGSTGEMVQVWSNEKERQITTQPGRPLTDICEEGGFVFDLYLYLRHLRPIFVKKKEGQEGGQKQIIWMKDLLIPGWESNFDSTDHWFPSVDIHAAYILTYGHTDTQCFTRRHFLTTGRQRRSQTAC